MGNKQRTIFFILQTISQHNHTDPIFTSISSYMKFQARRMFWFFFHTKKQSAQQELFQRSYKLFLKMQVDGGYVR